MATPSPAGNPASKFFWRKKPGSIQIADLCALGLLEANFNAAMNGQSLYGLTSPAG